MRAARLIPLIVLTLVGYLATGLVIVGQDEVGVVRRFGAVDPEPWEPGLHWGLPWGLGRVDLVKLGETRAVTVGAPGDLAAPLSRAPDPASDERLTGDLNLITVEASLQYHVIQPEAFLFATESIEVALRLATESALTRVIASRNVDDLLTSGRGETADRMRAEIQAEADQHKLGVSIRAVRLGRVAPPLAVAPAFADAARARSDRRQAVTRAEEDRDRFRADARGREREINDRAEASASRAVELAKGDADRFRKRLAEYQRSPAAMKRRLYLETLAEIWPRIPRKLVTSPGGAVDLTVPPEPPAATDAVAK